MFKRKDFIWNTAGTLFHAFNSLFFLIAVNRINGLSDAGIFSYGFAIANIFYIVAIYGGRNFQVTDVKNEISPSSYVSFRLFSSFAAIVIAILVVALNGYALEKFLIILFLCAVKCVEAISDVFHGIIQKGDRLHIVGKSFVFKNFVSLTVFMVVDLVFSNVLLTVISWLLINILFLIFYDIRQALNLEKIRIILGNQFSEILRKCFFTCAFTTLSLFVINIPRYFIDFNLNDEAQGVFGIVLMPATIIIILGQFITNPVLNDLAKSYHNNNVRGFVSLVSKLSLIVIGSTLLVLVLAFFFGIPVLNSLFDISLDAHRNHLLIIIVGAALYTIITIISVALITMRKTAIQLIMYAMMALFGLLVSMVLINAYQLAGGFYSYFLTMLFGVICYVMAFLSYLKYSINKTVMKK